MYADPAVDTKTEPVNTVFSFSIGGPSQLMPGVASLVSDGLFDRFPRLKVAVVEAGAGFAGYLIDRMDSKFDRFGTMVQRPLAPAPIPVIADDAVGSTPAVQNAVVDALSHLGVRHIDMPTTPQRVWQAITDAREARG